MATTISSHVKDNKKKKNSIFTARDEDDFLVKGRNLLFHQYLYNKMIYILLITGRDNQINIISHVQPS